MISTIITFITNSLFGLVFPSYVINTLLIAISILAILSIFSFIYGQTYYRHDRFYRRLYSKWASTGIQTAIMEGVLVWTNISRISLLGWRLWHYVWILWLLYWLGKGLYWRWKILPRLLEEQKQKELKEKYLK